MTRPRPDQPKAKVLVVSASVGAGHNQAARAIVAGLGRAAPHVSAEFVDLLPMTPWVFRAYYAGGYAYTVSRLPWCYGAGFWLTDRPHRPGRSLEERRRLWTERLTMRRFARWLVEQDADLIVNTHFLSPPLVGWMIGRGRLRARQMVVVTDTDAHRFWYAENVHRYYLSGEDALERMARWGIEPGRATVSGMPVHPKWLAPLEREKVLADWRLPADRKIVVLSGGADFTCGPVLAIARRVQAECPRACVVVLAGRDKRLLGRLARGAGRGEGLVGVSFTDRVHELIHVADLMITKAGGSTTAECLAKGTPMVLLKPVPGQESRNARYYTAQGAAVVARDPRGAASEAARLLRDEPALARMAAAARGLYRPATETIVAGILDTLQTPR